MLETDKLNPNVASEKGVHPQESELYDEQDVIRQAQKGEEHAFTLLVQRYYAPIFSFLYRLTGGDREGAEDLAQETFLRCYRYMKWYNARYAFSTWLFTIAVNVCKKHWRKDAAVEKRESPSGEGESCVKDARSNVASPLGQLVQQEEAQALLQHLRTLPREGAMALMLREYERMSYEQIAEVLRTNVNTAKSWVFRAKQALAQKLTNHR